MSKTVVFNLEVDSNLNDVDKSIQDIVSSTDDLKKQFKELQKAAVNATNPEDLQKYAKAAGEVRDRIGDANQQIRQFASDTQKLDLAIGAVQGLAGAFAVVQGTTALFGEENEELNKTLLKVQGSIAVLNGLQQVANTLNKDSVVGTKLYAAANAILNSSFLNVNKGLKAFRIALISTGVGAIVVGLGLLIANFDSLRDAVLKLIPGLKAVGDFFKKIVQSITDYVGITSAATRALEAFNKAQDIKIANTAREIENLKQLGATQREIYEAENRLIDQKIRKLEELLETNGVLTDEESKLLNELLAQRSRLENQYYVDSQAALKKDQENKIALIKNDFQRRLAEIRLQRKRELEEAERKGLDKTIIIKKFAIIEENLIKERNDKIADRQFSSDQELRRLSGQKLQAEIKDLEKERDIKIQAAEGNNDEILKIQQIFSIKVSELIKKEGEELLKTEQFNLKQRLEAIDFYYNQLFISVERNEERLNKSQQLIRKKELKAEKDALIEKVTFEDLTNTERRYKREAEAYFQIVDQRELNVELEKLDKSQFETTELYEKAKFDIRKKYYNEREKTDKILSRVFLQQEIDYLQRYNEVLNKNFDANAEAILANNKKIMEYQKQYYGELDREEEESFNRRQRRILENNNLQQDAFTGLFNLLDGLNVAYENSQDKTTEQQEKRAKRAFENNKKLQIAQALISTYGGAVQAYQSQIIPLDPTSVIRGAIAAAAVVASGLGRVAAIRSTQFNGGGSTGGGSAAVAPTTPSNPFTAGQSSPIVPEVMLGKRDGDDMRVYVLEGDIRNTGRRVDVIEGRARGRF